MRKFIFALLLLGLTSPAHAQSVQQSGTVTPGHAAQWVTNGVVKDGGTAANGSLTSLGVTNNGTGICQNSAATTAAGYQQICLGTTTSGGGVISVQNFGTATAQGLTFNINGTPVTVPTGGDVFPTLTLPITDQSLVCANGTTGLLRGCFVTVPVASGGTGATTASGARTNLGLGTLALQNANAVAITGGTITGMPNPSVGSDVANKTYVDATSQGLHILSPVRLATAAVLPNTPSYGNGSSGVGATLTAGGNAALTVDGTAAVLTNRILVKNQASALQNGIYTVTTAGDGSTPWVLTRATDFDTAGEMLAGSYTLITAGSTNTGAAYTLQTTVATVGSDSVTFIQFSNANSGVTLLGGVNGVITLGGSLTMVGSTLQDAVRTRLTTAATYYVRTDGNDNCNGTTNAGGSSGNCAWLTIAHGLSYIRDNIDLAGFVLTLSLPQSGSNTFTMPTGDTCSGPFTGATGPASVVVQGNGTWNTTATLLDGTTNATFGFRASNGCEVTLSQFTIRSGVAGISADFYSKILFGNILWQGSNTATTAGFDILAYRGSYIEQTGQDIIQYSSGRSLIHVGGIHQGEFRNSGQTTTFGSSAAYGGAPNAGYAFAAILGIVVYTSSPTINTNGQTITGTRCYASLNAVIEQAALGPTFFPGDSACSSATGGQVAQ